MPSIAHIFRHPIKAIGLEEVTSVQLEPGKTMPWDRVWGVAHEAAKITPDDGEWARCMNFVRGASSPALMAVRVRVNTDSTLTLSHPEQPDLTLDPETQGSALVDWVRPICNPGRAQPSFVYRADIGITDSKFPSISILGLPSLRALGERLGTQLSPLRFRGNLWLDGLEPWQEFDWIGKSLRIGTVELEIRERITRCSATTANPDTGKIDADTLGALETHWNHQNFGVYGVITKAGTISKNDRLQVL